MWGLKARTGSKGQGSLVCRGSWGHRVGHDEVTELNWMPEQLRLLDETTQ